MLVLTFFEGHHGRDVFPVVYISGQRCFIFSALFVRQQFVSSFNLKCKK